MTLSNPRHQDRWHKTRLNAGDQSQAEVEANVARLHAFMIKASPQVDHDKIGTYREWVLWHSVVNQAEHAADQLKRRLDEMRA